MKNEKLWKGIIIGILLTFLWIRLSPAIAWTIRAREIVEYNQNKWNECYDFVITYDWSWWSLRFTSVYPDGK